MGWPSRLLLMLVLGCLSLGPLAAAEAEGGKMRVIAGTGGKPALLLSPAPVYWTAHLGQQ